MVQKLEADRALQRWGAGLGPGGLLGLQVLSTRSRPCGTDGLHLGRRMTGRGGPEARPSLSKAHLWLAGEGWQGGRSGRGAAGRAGGGGAGSLGVTRGRNHSAHATWPGSAPRRLKAQADTAQAALAGAGDPTDPALVSLADTLYK